MSVECTIRSVLIANRGEIAVRVMQTAKERGIRTVAIFSDPDAGAFHVREADVAVPIGGASAAESYLNIDAVIEAARLSGVDAIHPGYGFLAERPDFAEAVVAAGFIFIGPDASAIAAMGDKASSKRLMIDAGVPTIPGYQDEDQSLATLTDAAKNIGFPVMLKASAGGGGRGQRIVTELGDLESAIASARRESKSAFGDDRLIIEKAVVGARHVEIQVIADAHGAIVHLGERDCSLQRRRQKVIEEAPSPVVTPALRERMGSAAIEAARAVDYRNAGTVEFLLDPATDEFFFLEMNTRIQVEHPVTESVTAVDLVDLQFDVAEGKALNLQQAELAPEGWAMEARIYAEDPGRGFIPQTGTITYADFPFDPDIRCDIGVETGDVVTAFYDPMIAKVIAEGATRDAARQKLASYLESVTILGVTTNATFLIAALRDQKFAAGEADIAHIEANLETTVRAVRPTSAEDVALTAAILCDKRVDPLLAGWSSRGGVTFPFTLMAGEDSLKSMVTIDGRNVTAVLGKDAADIHVLYEDDDEIHYKFNGLVKIAIWAREPLVSGDAVDLKIDGVSRRLVDMTFAPAAEAGGGADFVKAPMAGSVTSIAVTAGEAVIKGQTVATIEAMKMEHQLKAPRDGVVANVAVRVGQQIAIRAEIISLEME